MRTYEPHRQLKAIRAALHITQMRLAEMLGVSYPYLLSVETGQRDMSAPLARKLAWLLGIPTNRIRDKGAAPMAWDKASKKLVPFSSVTFEKHSAQLPTFQLPDTGTRVTPSLEGYARAFHAVLDSAAAKQRLGPVLESFFALFVENFSTDEMIDGFRASYRKLYPHDNGAARLALLGQIHAIREWEDSFPREPRKRRRQTKKRI
jgi:DNA-binding XRE family transcriptional regulator